ncbi:MAG TPA: restriction endonuclease subunit S [Oculatellaceae cyanobacterium]
MREGWVKKTLGEVCIVERGSSPRPIERYLTESSDGVNWVKIGDTKNVDKYIRSTKQKITRAGAEKSRRVDPGDFILSNSMSFGKPYIMATSGYVHDGWFILRLLESIDIDFFHYLLSSDFVQAQFISLAAGSVVKNISKDLVKRAVLPIPPLPDQKRIVAILDEAFDGIDRAIANTEKNLANSRELFESYLNAILTQKCHGWVEKKLGEVCKVKDGTHFSPKNSDNGKYMYITAKNIKPYYINLSKITFISEEDHQKIYSRCPVKKGDVLYIKDGATAGIAAINNLEEEFSLLSSVAVFKTSSQILNTYLVHYVNSNLGRKNFLGYVDGAAITRLTLTKLNNVLIPVPPLSEQQEIVTKLDALSTETQRLETIYRQKLAALNELKQSILQKAFTGELTTDTANQTTKAAQEVSAA